MSGILPNGKQQFIDSNGNPLASGKVYYYIPSTTTFKNTWQDPALTILNTNPIQLDANGQCIAYGSGSYRQQVYDANNNLIWDQESDAPLSLADFELPAGASYIGYNEGSTGAVNRTVQTKLQESISVKDFGAKGDGSTDDTAAFNAAILAVAIAGGGTIIAPNANYYIAGTILLPSNIHLDLMNSTITGAGIGSSGDLFQSAYLSGGTIITNIGTSAESHLVQQTIVTNAIINNCGKAFNIYNFVDNCEISNIKFNNCTYAIYSDSCFYCRFINLFSRGSASSATNAAFYFANYVNVQAIESVFVTGRTIGIEVTGGANGLVLQSCSAEECATGMLVNGQNGPLKFDTCYFEANTSIGLDLGNSGSKNPVTIDNCWFYGNATAINGTPVNAGEALIINANNTFLNNTTNINIVDTIADKSNISLVSGSYPDNAVPPALPSGYNLVPQSNVDYKITIFNSATGLPIIKSAVHGPTLIAFENEGNPGAPEAGTVSFCSNSKSSGTTFSVYVDTSIVYQEFNSLLVYRFEVIDNVSTYKMFGLVFGDSVTVLDSTGKTVSVSNNGGNVRLTLGTFSHPSGSYQITGVVRHI